MIFKHAPTPHRPVNFLNGDIHQWFMYKCMEVYQGEMKLLKCINILRIHNDRWLPDQLLANFQLGKAIQIENLEKIFLLIDLPVGGKKNALMDFLLDQCFDYGANSDGRSQNYFQLSQVILAINSLVHFSYRWMEETAKQLQQKEVFPLLAENLRIEGEIGNKLIAWSTSLHKEELPISKT
ncbi:hypothetical protein FKX85_15415 [Echinicola soli]|uniref:Uncharacterized protein n=1 Tax=Echinicola soli TaxID=2591634 RepID=A0A514CKN2_9BACT|nr:hypothetical protein [Echinicola soli]QDH80350.1 hypothetical protein FKX85_15415 [Echinicola soli]